MERQKKRRNKLPPTKKHTGHRPHNNQRVSQPVGNGFKANPDAHSRLRPTNCLHPTHKDLILAKGRIILTVG
eukprot:2831088-Amphidinium_carterae.1